MKLPALRVENLACERGGRTLFRDLSFTVERGGGLVLTGPNGVGKTSLLRILGGLLKPSAGRVWIEGGDAEAGLAEQSHLIGMREALKPSLTVIEHLRFWRELLGGEASPPSHQDEPDASGRGAGQLSTGASGAGGATAGCLPVLRSAPPAGPRPPCLRETPGLASGRALQRA